MRFTRLPLATLKDVPAEAEVISHKLMLRAGLVRRVASGIYSWLPVGYRVVRKVTEIVREEMDAAGALELLMPSIQPAKLWQESGRWEEYGPELLRLKDRHERDFCYGPTHEEVITDIARRDIKSYRQLPVSYYQIQTKFRDEIRPRFGVMRAREFTMKDAYSFHLDDASLNETYERMHQAYSTIFTRLGLEFRAVRAESGAIGGSYSHEFHVLAASGEDSIAYSDGDDYAANIELAEALPPPEQRAKPSQAMEKVSTPKMRTIEEICNFLNISPDQCIKTLLVEADDSGVVALALRGDHELNAHKAESLDGVAIPLRMAVAEKIKATTGCEPGFVGPVDLDVRSYADFSALAAANFVCGANEADHHLIGVNWGRDVAEPEAADIRNVVNGDPSPGGKGKLTVKRGIEVGHIFKLGTKYSESMAATVVDESGQSQPMVMGSYGIGVTRIVAAAIEQNNDERGIIWPAAIAPYSVALVPINLRKSQRVREASEKIYSDLTGAGFEVLFDDRDVTPGVKFADVDLIGIPHRIVVAERGLDKGTLEYKYRTATDTIDIAPKELEEYLRARMAED